MSTLDALTLARRQLARDTERTARFPLLLKRKIARMSASPFAFLRGAAPLYYELLEKRPELAKGPAGEGWISGDLHLENFGAYRAAASAIGNATEKEKEPVEFNLNDFDEAVDGPWRFDVLRVTTSLIVAGRELGADGPRALSLCARFLSAYTEVACGDAAVRPTPKAVATLVSAVRERPKKTLLDERTEVVKGKRRIVRGEKYFDLPADIAAAVPAALDAFVPAGAGDDRPKHGQLALVDAAFRVAGTGSLGALRVAALVEGKGSDGNWIFDIKEQGAPACEALVATPEGEPAARVVKGIHACVARPPRMIGTTTLLGKSMLVRRLSPQEDKLDLSHLANAELDGLADYLGALTGAAHRRGASKMPKAPWSDEEREQIVDNAILLAGIHEAAYLAWCRITR